MRHKLERCIWRRREEEGGEEGRTDEMKAKRNRKGKERETEGGRGGHRIRPTQLGCCLVAGPGGPG